ALAGVLEERLELLLADLAVAVGVDPLEELGGVALELPLLVAGLVVGPHAARRQHHRAHQGRAQNPPHQIRLLAWRVPRPRPPPRGGPPAPRPGAAADRAGGRPGPHARREHLTLEHQDQRGPGCRPPGGPPPWTTPSRC